MATKKDKKEESKDLVVINRATSADLTDLSPELQAALKAYDTREIVGVTKQWKAENPGDYIVGSVIGVRNNIGKFDGTAMIMDTVDGPRAVFLNGDMRVKLGEDEEKLIGKNLVIQYMGMMYKKENPALVDDMKVYKVLQVTPRKQ
jgi:hypothetical protein